MQTHTAVHVHRMVMRVRHLLTMLRRQSTRMSTMCFLLQTSFELEAHGARVQFPMSLAALVQDHFIHEAIHDNQECMLIAHIQAQMID